MSTNSYSPPSFFRRIYSVWYRHTRVYNSDFLSNAFPPFFEPLLFLLGLGFGLGAYVQGVGDAGYLPFLASGLLVTSPMYSSSFECTYGTFIRLEFDKIYDGMLGAPLLPKDVVIGEILFAGTKSGLFGIAVLSVIWTLGVIRTPLSLLTPVVGVVTGLMFASLAMLVTSFVRNINHFNFYFTGLVTPMFFFSGVVFPLDRMPKFMAIAAEFLPLTHAVRWVRALCGTEFHINLSLMGSALYAVAFILLVGFYAVQRISRRLVD